MSEAFYSLREQGLQCMREGDFDAAERRFVAAGACAQELRRVEGVAAGHAHVRTFTAEADLNLAFSHMKLGISTRSRSGAESARRRGSTS